MLQNKNNNFSFEKFIMISNVWLLHQQDFLKYTLLLVEEGKVVAAVKSCFPKFTIFVPNYRSDLQLLYLEVQTMLKFNSTCNLHKMVCKTITKCSSLMYMCQHIYTYFYKLLFPGNNISGPVNKNLNYNVLIEHQIYKGTIIIQTYQGVAGLIKPGL